MAPQLQAEPHQLKPWEWELLPFRFHRFDSEQVLVTNMVGEHAFLDPRTFASIVDGTCADQAALAELRAKHMIRAVGDSLPVHLLAMKLRTRTRRLAN